MAHPTDRDLRICTWKDCHTTSSNSISCNCSRGTSPKRPSSRSLCPTFLCSMRTRCRAPLMLALERKTKLVSPRKNSTVSLLLLAPTDSALNHISVLTDSLVRCSASTNTSLSATRTSECSLFAAFLRRSDARISKRCVKNSAKSKRSL